jgi:ATP-dependent 26S proteasome regulatory subunit
MYALLSELDRVADHVLVIATTNQLDKVDKTVRRGGRLDIDIRLDMPSDDDRYQVFLHHLNQAGHDIDL